MKNVIQKHNNQLHRRGTTSLYAVVLSVPIIIAFGTFAVDLGRVQNAKSQLQAATDAAARYAATGMRSTMLGNSGANANATAVFAENKVDGAAIPFNSTSDLELGIWNSGTRTFTATADTSLANCVRVHTSVTLGGAARPLTFLSMLGKEITIHAESIALVVGQDASTFVSGKGNPWLSGMPAGSVSNDFRTSSAEWDYAGSGPNDLSSPAMISLATLNTAAGGTINFDGVTGAASFGGGTTFTSDADGDSSMLCTLGSPSFGNNSYLSSSMNGMSNCYAPVNALMAVFMNDSVPNSSAAPSPLDFSTESSRDYTSLSPSLKQVFFVGDGRKSNGEIQQIVVPPGATRMYVANMDGWQYNNNTGGFHLTVHATTRIRTVLMK